MDVYCLSSRRGGEAAMRGGSVPKFRARAFEPFVHGHVLDLQPVLERVFRQACQCVLRGRPSILQASLFVCLLGKKKCVRRVHK